MRAVGWARSRGFVHAARRRGAAKEIPFNPTHYNGTVLDSVYLLLYSCLQSMKDSTTLAELSDESGIPARTIRFYIARGLLEGPVKAGRGAVYTAEHLARLQKIKALQGEGRMLAEIAHDLEGGPPTRQPATLPSPWWQYVIEDDVTVWVRSDVSPWRMKQIRAAVNEMASRLREPENSNPRSNRR